MGQVVGLLEVFGFLGCLKIGSWNPFSGNETEGEGEEDDDDKGWVYVLQRICWSCLIWCSILPVWFIMHKVLSRCVLLVLGL